LARAQSAIMVPRSVGLFGKGSERRSCRLPRERHSSTSHCCQGRSMRAPQDGRGWVVHRPVWLDRWDFGICSGVQSSGLSSSPRFGRPTRSSVGSIRQSGYLGLGLAPATPNCPSPATPSVVSNPSAMNRHDLEELGLRRSDSPLLPRCPMRGPEDWPRLLLRRGCRVER